MAMTTPATTSTRRLVLFAVIGIGLAVMMTGGGGGLDGLILSSSSPYYSLQAFTFGFAPLSLVYSVAIRAMYPAFKKTSLLADDASTLIFLPKDHHHSLQNRPRFAIVTGANTGIGYETAKALVQHHNVNVILACRSRDKAVTAAQQINRGRHTGGTAQAMVLETPLDLVSSSSIVEFVQELVQRNYHIDILVNNAGRNTHPEALTPNDDNDNSNHRNGLFQANFLGHYELTALLLAHDRFVPDGARIVNLSSIMHHFVGHATDTKLAEMWMSVMVGAPPTIDTTYSMSKLAMIHFSDELNRKYASSRNIRAVAVNPGAV